MGVPALSAALLLAAFSVENSAVRFTDVTRETGLDVVNVSGDVPKHVIVSSLGGGVALFDYDGDGDLDAYFVNGQRLDGMERVSEGGNRLFRNEGNWVFHDVTSAAGVGDEGWGVGSAVGDYDGDGAPDLYVTNIGRNVLYRNRGDGTFEDVAEAAGVGDERFGASAAFFDADGDGDLDLYVANYVDPDLTKIPAPGSEPTCTWLGLAVMCGPKGLDGQSDVFYRNEGDAFVDATKESGLFDETRAFGLGIVTGDYDQDGDADLYVANDTHPNFLFRNDGSGRFEEVGLLSGVAYNASGDTEAGMGVDFGDPNGDGVWDLIVTNFSHETNTLYLGSEMGLFTDATDEMGLGSPSLGRLGWGTKFVDFDHDGDEDVFVANGHVYPRVAEADDSTSYRQANQVFLNGGDGRFVDAGLDSDERPSRGVAFGDVDDDGDTDLFVVNIEEAPSLLRNDLPEGPESHWIGLRLVGRASNRDAIGARVRLRSGERWQMREVRTSGSIFSSNDPRVHFGLGSSAMADEIAILWPSGEESRLTNVEASRYILVVEPKKGTGLDGPRFQ